MMPVDNDDPTKHRKSNGSSSQSSADGHHVDDEKSQQLSSTISTRPTAQTSPQQRATSIHLPRSRQEKFVENSKDDLFSRHVLLLQFLVRHCDLTPFFVQA